MLNLHLGEVPEHIPHWWVDEFYAPFGDVKYDSADGQVTCGLWDAPRTGSNRLKMCRRVPSHHRV